jgi:hypothetical protein
MKKLQAVLTAEISIAHNTRRCHDVKSAQIKLAGFPVGKNPAENSALKIG